MNQLCQKLKLLAESNMKPKMPCHELIILKSLTFKYVDDSR